MGIKKEKKKKKDEMYLLQGIQRRVSLHVENYLRELLIET